MTTIPVVKAVVAAGGIAVHSIDGEVFGVSTQHPPQTAKGYCANPGHQEDEAGLVYIDAYSLKQTRTSDSLFFHVIIYSFSML